MKSFLRVSNALLSLQIKCSAYIYAVKFIRGLNDRRFIVVCPLPAHFGGKFRLIAQSDVDTADAPRRALFF